MDIGIYYLYEHKNNQKLRNTGFMKITRQEHTCFLQLNARSLPVTKQDTAELSAFYMENDSAKAVHLSNISCGNQTISGKIAAAETLFPNQYTLNQIDGFFLTLPHGEILSATAPNAKFDTRKITFLSGKVMTETAEPESVSNSPKNEPESQAETLSETPESQAKAHADTPESEPMTETLSETSESQTEAQHKTPESQAETPSEARESQAETPSEACESQAETPSEARESQAEAHAQTSGSELQKSSEPKSSARKIQRSELSALPRRHWNLANNSFLLHGYYNYNHLLLVEEDGHYWLGVPGIYDPRESRAAELFGFSQFTDSYNQQLALAEDECTKYGRFGYWCRYLK